LVFFFFFFFLWICFLGVEEESFFLCAEPEVFLSMCRMMPSPPPPPPLFALRIADPLTSGDVASFFLHPRVLRLVFLLTTSIFKSEGFSCESLRFVSTELKGSDHLFSFRLVSCNPIHYETFLFSVDGNFSPFSSNALPSFNLSEIFSFPAPSQLVRAFSFSRASDNKIPPLLT